MLLLLLSFNFSIYGTHVLNMWIHVLNMRILALIFPISVRHSRMLPDFSPSWIWGLFFFYEIEKPDTDGPWCTFLIVQPQYIWSSFRMGNPNPCETHIYYTELSSACTASLSALHLCQSDMNNSIWPSQCVGHLYLPLSILSYLEHKSHFPATWCCS